MGDVVRMPALAEVLAVVCSDTHCAGWWRAEIAAGLRVECGDRGASTPTATVPWAHATPADTLAALVEASLVPEAWLDPERGPRWRCEACDDTGMVSRNPRGHGNRYGWKVCDKCDCGEFDSPPSHAALVAVASLGADTLARAEELVGDVWRSRVVWRVESAARIREELDGAVDTGGFGVERAVHVAVVAWFYPDDAADAVQWHDDHPEARAGADLAGLGAWVLAVDDGRVTLAVEALL